MFLIGNTLKHSGGGKTCHGKVADCGVHAPPPHVTPESPLGACFLPSSVSGNTAGVWMSSAPSEKSSKWTW